MREEALQTGELIKYDGQDIGSLIAIKRKGGGGKFHVLDVTIKALLQRHGWSMSKIMVYANKYKSASLINA